jgi:hypothetical protein
MESILFIFEGARYRNIAVQIALDLLPNKCRYISVHKILNNVMKQKTFAITGRTYKQIS